MIIRTPIHDDDGSGHTGTIINNAWKTELYNQIDGYVRGNAYEVPYDGSMFSASSGTLTVSSGAYQFIRFTMLDKTAFFYMSISGAVTSASTVRLFITLPPGLVPTTTRALSVPAITYYIPGGGAGTGYVELGGTNVNMLRDMLGTPWPAASGILLTGQWFYETP